ncbi:3-hydroxyacyl-CoA dehydrogenase [Colletotrichum tofieldiae]|nr:3-hydroxyacyl-CoA dehydrogenase [Colletotrichum tofieldiae]GKT74890.1 3-hydroxyacyl-CoA dehydrogenase [Colletotrichum tofieldiae]
MASLPSNYNDRPVAILGGGVLGRRIACIWASGGYDVQVREPDTKQHQPCVDYVKQNIDSYPASGRRRPGTIEVFQDLEAAVKNAWLVIEAVPERIQIKIDTFAELEAKAPADAILASNSETLSILAEGVSSPEEIDTLFYELTKNGKGPCKLMDGEFFHFFSFGLHVGLDTVAFIEDHYVKERGLSPENTVDFLQREYLSKGKLGHKSAKGGLYPHLPKIVALDLGLANPNDHSTSGQILQLSSEGKLERVLVERQHVPDGIDIDTETRRMFWTCMGTPGEQDGEVFSANLDGSDVKSLFAPATINTPKQLVIEPTSRKIYFSDREGMKVYRSNLDGSDLETLTVGGHDASDLKSWCVGISVAPKLGKFYWTQKGAPKSGQGRIFCANIEMPEGKTAETRDDIVCFLGDLPEPIDLEVDEETNTIFWTDRGEIPKGNTLNKASIDPNTGLLRAEGAKKYDILVRHLNEAIGVKLDQENGHVYFSDLGGSIYRCNVDGSEKKKIFSDDNRTISGISVLRF